MSCNDLLSRLLLLMVCACGLPGCATIMSDRTYPVTVDNSGGQTYFSIRDRKNQVVHEGVTPSQVNLDAKSHPFFPAKYDVTFVGSDNVVQQREVKAGVDPWIAGNILLGGVIGTVVDGATGSMFSLPDRVTGTIAEQYAITDMRLGAQIASAYSPSNKANSGETETIVEQVTYQSGSDVVTR